ncbi:MAG: DUF4115 domain-containing protein [Candidatus Thiodiazotropha sp. (ex Monitilora ramsayi)]|nr:DUF4115 domain-containing protein [Candidatus Thiodiazotropha sp. (ex Monitilora ramsayi)]
MKSKTTDIDNSQSEGPIDGPGSQLRKARERQGLEQAKVAARLHLSHSTIQALEWDDYESLPSAVFVQGYLRNYARLVNVDEEAVITAYQELNPSAEHAPLPKNQPDDVAKELHGDHRLFRILTWSVVFLLGILLFFWWQGRIDLPETESEPPVETPDIGLSGFPESVPETDGGDLPPLSDAGSPTQTEGSSPLTEIDNLPEIEREPLPAEPEPEQVLSEDPAEVLTEMPAADEVSTPAVTDETVGSPGIEPTPDPVADVPVTSAEEPVEVAASQGTVGFEFTGSCWIEVRDVTGRARILGVKRDGVRRTLDGRSGPYRVVIGDINAVKVTVNGNDFDLKPYARGKVARFTLDPSRL